MRKRLAFVALLIAVALPTLGGSPAAIKTGDDLSRSGTCPKGSHLISCPQGNYCCPDGALCTCGPY